VFERTGGGDAGTGGRANYQSVSWPSNAPGLPLAAALPTRIPKRLTPPHGAVPAARDAEVVPITPRTTKVLILARETVIAALIGMLLEMEHFEPVFAEPDERPEDALSRLRPPLVIVIDGELDAARSDLFFARASAARARVVLFSEPLAAADVQAAARVRRLPFFAMPVDRATLGQVLASASAE
jgi:hypothetical protein